MMINKWNNYTCLDMGRQWFMVVFEHGNFAVPWAHHLLRMFL